jgi:hypothetical protein
MVAKNWGAILASLIVVALSWAWMPSASAQIVRQGATTFLIYNASNADVPVMVTVPGLPCAAPCVQSDGCPTGTVAPIKWVDVTAHTQPKSLTLFGSPAEGWFILKRGHKAQLINMGYNPVTGKQSSCLQGVLVGFGQIGNSCPDFGGSGTAFPDTTIGPNFNNPTNTRKLPNGSNSFEVTLNLPGTVNGATVVNTTAVPTPESVDISCVNGVNATLVGQLTPPAGGPYWTADLGPAGGGLKTYTSTAVFRNSWLNIDKGCDDNCKDPKTGLARPGVFPYGCSQCNRNPDPAPPCAPHSPAQICAAQNMLAPNNGCGFNRSPAIKGIQKFGGTVQVTYLGPLSPPSVCP